MTDPASLRRRMVETQLVARGIRHPAVLRAMGAVPRERFGMIRLIADIVSDEELERMPESDQMTAALLEIVVPRQPVPAAPEAAMRLIQAALAAASKQRNMGLQSARV